MNNSKRATARLLMISVLVFKCFSQIDSFYCRILFSMLNLSLFARLGEVLLAEY